MATGCPYAATCVRLRLSRLTLSLHVRTHADTGPSTWEISSLLPTPNCVEDGGPRVITDRRKNTTDGLSLWRQFSRPQCSTWL